MQFKTWLGSRFRHLSLALAVIAGTGAIFASPAAAWNSNDRAIYNERQTWFLVDRNRDGRISSKEWDYATDHGYNKLNGVPKKRLTRNEYQAYLSAYLERRHAFGRNPWWERDADHDRDWDGRKKNGRTWNHDYSGNNTVGWQGPWYVSPRGAAPWTYGAQNPQWQNPGWQNPGWQNPDQQRGGHRTR